jgi:uncharacterized membrane protein YfcA
MSTLVIILGGLAIGSIAGVLSGLFGIGGGIVIVPMLALLLRFSPSKSVGTSLVAMLLPTGIVAVIKYAKAGQIDFKAAFAITFAMIVTGGIGASIGLNIGSAWVSRGFGILLLVVGVKFLITS